MQQAGKDAGRILVICNCLLVTGWKFGRKVLLRIIVAMHDCDGTFQEELVALKAK